MYSKYVYLICTFVPSFYVSKLQKCTLFFFEITIVLNVRWYLIPLFCTEIVAKYLTQNYIAILLFKNFLLLSIYISCNLYMTALCGSLISYKVNISGLFQVLLSKM